MIAIQNRYSGDVLCVGPTLREAVEGNKQFKPAWQSHDLWAEIFRQAAGDDPEKQMVADSVISNRRMCWKQFLSVDDSLLAWALSVIKPYVQEDAPGILIAAIADRSGK